MWLTLSDRAHGPAVVMAGACVQEENSETRETPSVAARGRQRNLREEQVRPIGVADRPVVPTKPGNSGGGKGPEFKVSAGSGAGQKGDW